MRENPLAGLDRCDPLWSSVLDALQGSLAPGAIRDITTQCRPLGHTAAELRICVADASLESWVTEGWIAQLIGALGQLTGPGCGLAIVPESAQTLEDFAVSPANRLACARAAEIATSPGRVPYLTVFHGPEGCGKTHLLRAIDRRLQRGQKPGSIVTRDVRALSLELMSSLYNDRSTSFRSQVQHAGALLLDSGEALRQRRLTQDQLSPAFELLERRHCPIVLCTRSEIFDDDCLQDRLRSRLREAQPLRLHPTGGAARIGIVTERLTAWGLAHSERTAARIVASQGPGLAGLDRRITSLFARCRSIMDAHDVELPGRPQHSASPHRAPADPHSVLKVVCQHFHLRPAELRAGGRSPRVTVPRQIAMYLMRRHSGLSYPEIGQRLHRHHTTGIHAYHRISSERRRNSDLRATLDLLEKELIRMPDDGNEG